jgi:hypothetical protein
MTKARDLANGGFGLVLVKPSSVVNGTDNGKGTVSFSAVSSVSLNGVFNSTYDNYRIVVNGSANSANDGNQFFRVRSGSSDVTSSTYVYSSFIKSGGGSDLSFNSGADTLIKIGAQDSAVVQGQSYCYDIISPFLTQYTKISGNSTFQTDTAAWSGGVVVGLNFNQISYDGFTIGTQNGTFTGIVSIYGYNK